MMPTFFRDLSYAMRQLRKAPGFTFVCILTLALGIGANTAIFTLVDAVMLKSLPVTKPAELYRLGDTLDCCINGDMDMGSWSLFPYDLYKQLRDHTPEFKEMAAFEAASSSLSVRRIGTAGTAKPFGGEFVSGNYFNTFGVGAFAGRVISPDDDQPGAEPVAVMSYPAWQQHYALDPTVIGSIVIVNQVPITVAGIAPPGFYGDRLQPNPPDFWLPIATEPAIHRENSFLHKFSFLYLIGRLKAGAQISKIQNETTLQLQQWISVQPNLDSGDRAKLSLQHITLSPAGRGVQGLQNQYRTGLRLLLTVAGLVLLVACANIANLLLARSAASRATTAVRVALGASRTRLVRQVLTESILLAVLGGIAGLAVAFAGTRAILALAFRGSHFVPINSSPSLPVLGFAFLLSLITGIVFGVVPAWITSHADPAEALRGKGRTTGERSFSQKSLVVLQIAVSVVLLVGAGLLTQTLRRLENQDFGFEIPGRLVVNVNPALAGYKPEKLASLYQALQDRLPRIPGVLNASYSLYSPMSGDNWMNGVSIESPASHQVGISFTRIGPKYFETTGTRLLRGRTIGEEDTPTSRKVAVVNQRFAEKCFPKEDPIGKRFGLGDMKNAGEIEIVGVVEDAKYQDSRGPAYPTTFMPFLQMTNQNDPQMAFLITSHFMTAIELQVAGKSENIESAVRRTLAEIDPNLTVTDVVSMREQVNLNFNQETLIARLTELFGGLALILACVGLYGVSAYAVARRTGEIGVRMALGADRANVLKLVLRGALVQLGIGLAIGVPVALASGRLLSNQLYGVKTYDPTVIALAVSVLAVCAILAGLIPARRAASIEPMQALRTE